MAAPMTPAKPSRALEISQKEAAIKRRLNAANLQAAGKARKSIDPKKGGSKKYTTQAIKGSKEGFSHSDYGVGSGAAIPYQIGTSSKTMTIKPPSKAKPKPKTITHGKIIDRKAVTKKLVSTWKSGSPISKK